MDEEMTKNKKAQTAIFIILGLIIVVGFLIVFLLTKPPEIKIIDEKNPQAFIESCSREAVEEAIDTLSKRGGDINPRGFISFEGEEITYLCYNVNDYEACVNQRPLLVEHIEEEITNQITPIIVGCFNELSLGLEENYDVESDSVFNVETKLQSENVEIDIDKKLKISRKEQVSEFDGFKIRLVHPIYDFAKLAMEIVNQESRYCNFDELGYMILHPEYDITKFITGEADIIYNIREVATDQEFRFAVKSCTLPAGY